MERVVDSGMNTYSIKNYPLDHSGIIHLAAMRKWHTNSFRLCVTLTERVDKFILQEALNKITPRFPTIVAGIVNDVFQFRVVPVDKAPYIRYQQERLSPMTKQEIQHCAMRILYIENQITGEFFHALTDGAGGCQFMKALLAEYFSLKYKLVIPMDADILFAEDMPSTAELSDDYFVFSGSKAEPLKCSKSYQLPNKAEYKEKLNITSKMFSTKELLGAAHDYGVSLTVFLTTVMAAAVAEIQQKHLRTGCREKPIQIMVPVNLRKMFPSKSLRNFTLFVLPRIEVGESKLPFDKMISIIKNQLTQQITKENMKMAMTAYTKLEKSIVFKRMPLVIKCAILRVAHWFCGEKTSCISLSNLGKISFPEEMAQHISQIDVTLTPRISSPYNCGVISFGDKCIINMSHYCIKPELEKYFFEKLSYYIAETKQGGHYESSNL